MNLFISICATASYTYAMRAQASRIVAAVLGAPRITHGTVVLVGDDSSEMQGAVAEYQAILPEHWSVKHIHERWRDKLKNYDEHAQRLIAEMRTAAFDEARRARADYCWSLDSDVLPQENALDVMIDSLQFDRGFYGVANCPYPSQGGGDFLGGRGTPERPILPDCYEDEHILPPALKSRIKRLEARFKALQGKTDDKWKKEQKEVAEEIQKSPSRGDVFFLNSCSGIQPFVQQLKARLENLFDGAKYAVKKLTAEIDLEAEQWKPRGFRRRGWLSSAYPGIGLGAMLPSDWCGFGCTLMNRKALALAQFDGYDGEGTEDLYVVWKRWHRSGIKINVIPHVAADHVVRNTEHIRGFDGKPIEGPYVLMQAYHEARDQEWIGHLRREPREWFQQLPGETPETMKPEEGKVDEVK